MDDKVQNIHYGLINRPGGKANYCTYGLPDAVKNGRFLAGRRFDFAEGAFEGVYQYGRPDDFYYPFGTYGADRSLAKAQAQAERAGQPFVDEPIRDVRQARQILAVKGRNLFIVTDRLTSAKPHHYTQHYTLYTPVRSDDVQKRLGLLRAEKIVPLLTDEENHILATRNLGLPNVEIRHIGALPLRYAVTADRRMDAALNGSFDAKNFTKGFPKRDRQEGERTGTIEFGQEVAVNWEAQGAHVLVSLVAAPGAAYTRDPPGVLRDVQPIALRAELTGFQGKFADGTDIAYLASAQPAELRLGAVEATASTLLIADGHGIALDCTSIGGTAPPQADFTFRVDAGRVIVEEPIYRPIQPVMIEPLPNVFTDSLRVTLRCATPGVEIRYTLDNSKPLPQSPMYSGPFLVNKSCRLKVRAFRPGVTTDIWQEDGTLATVVYSAVLRKESPAPAAAPAATKPGLRYEYFEGVWTELMANGSDIPAKTTGVLPKVLDVSPRQTDGAFGIRYEGFLDVPRDGVYTFYAPREFIFPDNDCGYDLRVFVDGKPWCPAVRWHSHGTWSMALEKGRHPFRVVFVDMRLKPHKVELMWGFPHPDFTWKGVAPDLRISGPGLEEQAVPESMLCY